MSNSSEERNMMTRTYYRTMRDCSLEKHPNLWLFLDAIFQFSLHSLLSSSPRISNQFYTFLSFSFTILSTSSVNSSSLLNSLP
ncbi:hypothetical protein P8452_76879 [Trifolium repens]|nr:hypothetical protein P8452_76879 [Trifolium repens]